MPRLPRRRRAAAPTILGITLVCALVAGCTGGSTDGSGSAPATAGAVGSPPKAESIPAEDGVELISRVYLPAAPGKAPLVVMPASWGAGADEYDRPARAFAQAGYVVVAYAQRGFEGSGGTIDFAGPATQGDVSSVVDWALRHTPADPKRIGALGISYGAGMSLLAAERDTRIRAVVAMSGWADLATAFAPDGVVNVQAFYALFRAPGVSRKAGLEVKSLGAALLTRRNAAAAAYLRQISPSRSAVTGVAALNRNRTAVMLASAYQDSIFSPASLVPFFERLTGPKRLQLESGDHGGPERVGLQGGRAQVWDDARAWLDHYLHGTDNGIDRAEPVQLTDVATGDRHRYRDLAALPRPTRLSLRAPGSDASAAPGAGSAWRLALSGGVDSPADAGAAQFAATRPYSPPAIPIAGVTAPAAATWTTDATTAPRTLAGDARVHLTVTPSAARCAVFLYLYDVDPAGTARLVTLAPHLVTGTPGRPQDVDVEFPLVSWTVAAGHRLALVVDTVDPRYEAATTQGTTVTLSSTAADPAGLSVPLS